jgi:hypothetical protein
MAGTRPVLYISAKEGSGTNLPDYSAAGNNLSGTLSAADIWNSNQTLPGKDYSFRFTETDDVITIAKSDATDFDYNEPFSISFWVKIPTFEGTWKGCIANTQRLVGTSGYRGWMISLNGTMDISFHLINQWNTSGKMIGRYSTEDPVDNAWHHIVCTYNGDADVNSVKIYLDSTEDSSLSTYLYSALGTNTIVSSEDIRIGESFKPAAASGGTTYNFRGGYMDEISIWNVELSQAEVTAIYNDGTPLDVSCGIDGALPGTIKNISGVERCSIKKVGSYEAKDVTSYSDTPKVAAVTKKLPISYYNMETGTGTTLTDRSNAGNGLDGTLSNSGMWDSATKAGGTYSLAFGADSDLVTIPKNSLTDFQYDQAFSISIWCRIASLSGTWKLLFSNDQGASAYKGYMIAMHPSYPILFYLGNAWNSSNKCIGRYASPTIANDAWRHIVCTYNGNTADSGIEIYVDGTVEDSYGGYPPTRGGIIPPNTDMVPTTDTRIGQGLGTSYHWTNGWVDEVSMWDFALSAAQVTTIYNSGTPLNVAAGIY